MKIIQTIAAQGDVLFRRIDAIPEEAKVEPRKGPIVVAHSETGHHHAIDEVQVQLLRLERDPMVCFLRIDAAHADIVHHRPHDTHETLQLGQGNWEVRRQREYTPEGWRRVED